MCGVFGSITQQRGSVDVGIIRALTLANRERGKQSLGFFDSTGEMLKKGKDPIDVLATEECTAFLDRIENNRSWFVVGHTRYSTRGKVCDENSHPFEYGEVIGAHNGIVTAPAEFTVDSEHLIDLLDKHQCYQQAFQDERGYWTLSWFDRRTNRVYVSNHDNTCGIVKYRGAWYFSSDPDHLCTVIGSREIISLEKGQVVSFGDNGEMKWEPKFESNIKFSCKHDLRTSGRSNYGGNYSYQNDYVGYSTSGTTKTNGGTTVIDPDKALDSYDAEFKEIWTKYAGACTTEGGK